MAATIELLVTVDRVTYPKPSQADTEPGLVWYIIKTDKGTAKGKMHFRPQEADKLKLVGSWSTYQGQKEFRFTGAQKDIPIDPRDQLRYVVAKTSGIGEAIEEQIWELWGDAWMEKVRPGVIPRLNGTKYDRLREMIDNFKIERDECEAICWLMGKGATLGMATAAWDQWGKQTIGVVESDCYRLAELSNYGFSSVDKSIRHAFQIADDDPRRIKSGVLYSMNQITAADNSTITTWNELYTKATEILNGMYGELISQACREMFESGVLRAFPATQSISTGTDYENAMIIWEYIR